MEQFRRTLTEWDALEKEIKEAEIEYWKANERLRRAQREKKEFEREYFDQKMKALP